MKSWLDGGAAVLLCVWADSDVVDMHAHTCWCSVVCVLVKQVLVCVSLPVSAGA